MLCFGWHCVGRAHRGLLQPGGNQRLRREGKSGKSGAKCGCHFLAVSRVAESATQSQLFPSSPATPPSLFAFLFTLLPSPILIHHSPFTPLSWTAVTLPAGQCWSVSPEPQIR